MLGPTAQTGILPFDDSGGDGSPPLLLIHALGADRRMWGDVISQLDPPRRCVAVDLFGAGAAPLFPAEAPTLADHVDALQRLVEELGLERVVPAGCAVGSMMACALARRLGSRAPALVLANPILRITRDAGEVLLDRGRRIRARGIG